WLSLIKLPGIPTVSLDASWQMVMGYGAQHDLQHGRDIVFTYGPLGYLLASTYMGAHFALCLAWQLVGNLLIAFALYRFGRELGGWRQALYYGYVWLFGSIYPDAMQMNFIAIFALLLMRPAYRKPAWLAAVGAAFAIFSLMKFTNLLLCGFSSAVLLVYYFLIRARRDAAWLTGSFVVVFFVAWFAHGQSLAALPDFFRYGLQVSTGYVEAMAVYETPLMFGIGLGALLAVAAYALLYVAGQPDRRTAWGTALILGAVIFINWKHGFVRADGHVIAHFVMCLLAVSAYPALTGDNGRWGAAKGALLTCCGLLSLTGIGLISLQAVTQAPAGWNRRLHATVSALLDPAGYKRSLDAGLKQLAQRLDQPNLRNIVEHSTVDHLGEDQIYTLLNHFNYTPRPAVQGYTTYTEGLNRLDEQFYLSPRAPQFVIQRFRTIDGRFPTLDDSLALRRLLETYDYTMEEGGLLLWEHAENPVVPGPETEKILLTKTIRFGEKIAVPDTGDRPVWARIVVKPTLLGALRKFFYKAPLLYLHTADTDNAAQQFQLIRAMAATGFLLNPFFIRGEDLSAFEMGRFNRRVTEFSVEAMPGGESWFASEIQVELRTLAPFPQSLANVNERLANRFRMMNRKPVAIEGFQPMQSVMLDGKEVLMMHADSHMAFALDAAVHSVRGKFGLIPGAYQNGHDTDGVDFVIEWLPPEGPAKVLFRRYLDPLHRAEDRGPQEFFFATGEATRGRLVFHTLSGPNHNRAFDWSYWTDLQFK
ncbi:MAG TPA: hypothetical protein VFJ90_10310, partial [Candidatus Didemnitutus sp.]|nr:hypothetical protein [Candidatus Didemnitutus sp.]